MIEPNNNFRYIINPGAGDTTVVPLGESDFKIEWSRQDEIEIQYKKEQPSKITFTGAAYQQLLYLENSIYRCQYVTLTVERRCLVDNVETWQAWFVGRISFNEGTWDLDRCLLEVKANKVNPDQCYQDNKSTDLDLFTVIPERHTIKVYDGTAAIETVSYTNTFTLPAPECITPYFPGGSVAAEAGYWKNYFWRKRYILTFCISVTRWARQVLTIACGSPDPGSDWHLISTDCPGTGKKFARKAVVFDCVDEDSPGFFSHSCEVLGVGGFNFIDNGLTLKSVLEAFAAQFCGDTVVVSDFFQINAEHISTNNPVTGDLSKTNNIFIFQKSDVKRPDATENATKAVWNFEKCLTAICEMFNCRFRFLDDGTLRIEHISYWAQNAGLDLTSDRYKKFVVWKKKYTYTTEKIPSKEKYTFMESLKDSDFEGLPIIYSGACVSEASNVTNHSVDDVTTDVDYCLTNGSSDSSFVSDSGFVFIATVPIGGDNVIITEDPILGDRRINNSLAWAQLHRDYHKYYRPLIKGNMNGVDTTFESARPTKKGEIITVPLCCGDEFNPDDTVKTVFGDGVVDKAVYSFKDNTIDLDLLYNIPELVANSAPVAVNDGFVLGIDDPLHGFTLDVMANDIDAENNVVSVVIVGPPLHGTATVNMDLTINYVRSPGPHVPDLFTYKLIDSFGVESNIALVTLTPVEI